MEKIPCQPIWGSAYDHAPVIQQYNFLKNSGCSPKIYGCYIDDVIWTYLVGETKATECTEGHVRMFLWEYENQLKGKKERKYVCSIKELSLEEFKKEKVKK